MSNAIKKMELLKEVNKGDVLTFKGTDNKYKAILCTSSYKEKSPYNYTFAALTFDNLDKPTTEAICETEFYGIGNRRNDHFKYSEHELKKMWTIHPEIKPYFLGTYGLIIWRKDFMKFRNEIEIVGNLKIVNNLDKNGTGSMNASNWNYLSDFFTDKYKRILNERGQKTFKVKAIIQD